MATKVTEKMILQDVRGSYVYVKEPKMKEDVDGTKKGAYSIQILLPKNDPQVKKFQAKVKKVAQGAFGEKVKMGMLKLPLRDGDTERDGEEYKGYHFINANKNISLGRKPGIVNRRGEPADPDDIEEYCYSGAYFHVSVTLYNFDYDGKKGVAVGLENVMLRKKGDRLDGSVSATSEFSEFADDSDDSEDSSESGQDDWDDDIAF